LRSLPQLAVVTHCSIFGSDSELRPVRRGGCWSAVLIHKTPVQVSPRLIPGPSRSAVRTRENRPRARALLRPFISFCHCCVESKKTESHRVRYWEIIADNLSKARWSWGCVSVVDCDGRMIFVADAHRGDGQRFVVRADEMLTAFVELELVIRSGRTPEDCVARGIWLDKLSPCW
jgi:hypothetical protein